MASELFCIDAPFDVRNPVGMKRARGAPVAARPGPSIDGRPLPALCHACATALRGSSPFRTRRVLSIAISTTLRSVCGR